MVQAAMKNILEPIFEAGFYPVSYGFRPGKSVHGAIEPLKRLLLPRGKPGKAGQLPYVWAIEGDIKGCFDNIDHHGLMERVRRRISDRKVTRLLVAFLKAGVLSNSQFLRTESGTPQGGILSPLLANIALGIIEERYERYTFPRGGSGVKGGPLVVLCDPQAITRKAMKYRSYDKSVGRPVFMPIRYADDFIILVAKDGPPEESRQVAQQEKAAITRQLQAQLGLSLAEEKTLITPVTSTMRFLGHHLRVRKHPRRGLVALAVIPKDRSQRLRHKIKGILSGSSRHKTLADQLRRINPLLRGWAHFYRHAWGAKRVFGAIDYHTWGAIRRWLQKKHPRVSRRSLYARYSWRKSRGRARRWGEGATQLFYLSTVRVCPFLFYFGWQKPPLFASTRVESPVRIERRTPGSARGVQKRADANR